MSLRLWKRLRSFKHPTAHRFKRVQPKIGVSLSKKQKSYFKRNKNFYSGELTRPIHKYLLMQLCNNNLHAPNKSSGTAHSACYVAEQLNNTDYSKKEYNKNETNQMYFSFLKTMYKANPTMANLKKVKIKAYKNNWFFNNPSAVPGVLKIRRMRTLHTQQRIFNKNCSFWCGRIQQSLLLYLSRLSLYKNNHSYWNMIKALESYWPILILKAGLDLNARNVREHMQHSHFLINGYKKQKRWSPSTPADFVKAQSHLHWASDSSSRIYFCFPKMFQKYSFIENI